MSRRIALAQLAPPFLFWILNSGFWIPLFVLPAYSQTAATGKVNPPDTRPPLIRSVSIDQRLGGQVPLDLVFHDEAGQRVTLGNYFQGKPVVLSLVYYGCPMLCSQVLNGLTSSLGVLSFDAGREFEVVTVSFDPRETPSQAAAKKETVMLRYKRPGASKGWHFLTGDQNSIASLAQSVGFRYAYDTDKNQYAHASGIMVLTPKGKLARYFYGIDYAPRDVRLGLIEAAENRIGSPVDKLLLYCYHYDPATGKYGAVVMNVVRLGGALTLFGLVALILLLKRRDAGPARRAAGGGA
jgi:protein SCO1/2